MAKNIKNDRIGKMIDVVKKVSGGDYTIRNDISGDNHEIDSLALEINSLIDTMYHLRTEHGLLMDSLTESFEKYQNLMAIIPGMVYLFAMHSDGSYFFPYVSGSSRALFGLEPKEIMRDGSLLLSRIHQDDREMIFDLIGESAKTFKPWKKEFRLIMNDAVRWFECISNPVRQADCEFIWDGIMLDITERKCAEEALRNSEERYRSILENMREGYFEVDLKGNMVFFNPSTINNLEYTESEFKGMNFRQFMDEENSRKVYNAFASVYASGETAGGLEWEVTSKSGQKIALEASISLIRDGKGSATGFSGVVRDFTKHKREEAALLVSAEKYRSLLENIEISYYEMDLRGNFTFVNDIMCRDFGYRREELVGMNYRVYSRPENLEWVKSMFREIYITGKPKTLLNYEVNRKDGSMMIIEQSTSLLRGASGEAIGFQGVGRDVTERNMAVQALKESEEKYRTVLEIMNEGYFENDLKGNFTFVNDAACRLIGYGRDDLIGTNYRKIHLPEVAGFLKEVYTRVYETGKPEFLAEYSVVRKDGSPRFHQLNVVLVRDSTGKPAFFRNLVRDITERKMAQEALRISEEKYRNILETMEEGLFEMNNRGDYTFVNDAACKLLGYERDEMIGKNYRMMKHSPETMRRLFEVYNRIYKTGGPAFLLDYEAIRKDGSVRIFQANAMLLRDNSGKPTGFRSLVRDVTERKIAEDALRKSEEKYRTILETMDEGLYENDMEGRYTFVNDAACRLTGYERDELIGKSFRILHPPETVRYLQSIYRRMYETGRTETPRDYEVIHKDGSLRIHQATAAFIRDHTGEIIGTRALVRDITDRKRAEDDLRKSEERYRMIAENMHDTIWTMDLDKNYTYISPSVFRMRGYTPEEIKNIPLNAQMTPASYAEIEKQLSEEMAREISGDAFDPNRSITMELELNHKSGGKVWVEVTATFIRDEKGKGIEILGITRDISERKRADEERARLEDQLVQSHKMESVGRLAGGVAHDFNNMLSVILGYSELIKIHMPQGDALLRDILEIERAATRSRDITSQLLAFSRKQIISPIPVDLNAMISDMQKTLSRLIGEDIDLRFYPGEKIWRIKFDPSQIQQILINLAANARDAMLKGGKLTIETTNVQINEAYCKMHIGFVPGNYVMLVVSDDGAGMDKETLEHVFEPFFTTKETGKGTGLGLATVYGIIKQNGAVINVFSESGRGTTFKIYIPRSREKEETQEESEDIQIARGAGTVVLVEDDEMVRKMTTEMLEALGYTVTASENALEALSFCESGKTQIDLVITDVVMPGMSGKELRDKLKTVNPEIKVLFMSGYTSNVIVHHGALEEGVHFVQKPFSMHELARKAREAIMSDGVDTP
jgi:two-component system, cell cycle sensor histidine kinase and response regulator CckA